MIVWGTRAPFSSQAFSPGPFSFGDVRQPGCSSRNALQAGVFPTPHDQPARSIVENNLLAALAWG